jgi:alkylation response protein AidB-like acyl-CoA dehydrogenase
MEHWLAVQAYEGMLRAVEGADTYAALRAGLRGKTAVAELAEQVLSRCTRVLGGGTFSRRSPFSGWFEDVRALGFLRPPWGLAFDSLYLTSFG